MSRRREFATGHFALVIGAGAMSVLIAVSAASRSLAAQQSPPGPYSRLLSAAEVERVTGLTGIRQVARGFALTPRVQTQGDLNFVRSDTLVVFINIGTAEALYRPAHDGFKDPTTGKMTTLVHTPVPGIGDEAFDAPTGAEQLLLYVRKGSQAVVVASAVGGAYPRSRQMVSQPQLRELAKIILSRM
jgi:hypothetical protein